MGESFGGLVGVIAGHADTFMKSEKPVKSRVFRKINLESFMRFLEISEK